MVINSADLREHVTRFGHETYMERFSENTVVTKYMELFDRISS